MAVCIVTGSAGLIGSESCSFFYEKGFEIVGVDNDLRAAFFGKEASTSWKRKQLEASLKNYSHQSLDIRDTEAIDHLFQKYSKQIKLVIHCAAQPSHDWAATDPQTDFTVNANGTLNLLEALRKYAPNAVFILISTNKVYGDRPNSLPLAEKETRWELSSEHPFFEKGIDESMSIDNSKHSLFGVSKTAGDLLAQEYGKYFGLQTGIFRGGCLTGPAHSGTQLHGFLAYLAKCAVESKEYTIFGYRGKQVRDNIHSYDLVNAFWQYFQNPRRGEVYNIGGSRHSNCSVLEAIRSCEKLTGKEFRYSYKDDGRIGDHIWWISDISKFKSHYPEWEFEYDINKILKEIIESAEQKK